MRERLTRARRAGARLGARRATPPSSTRSSPTTAGVAVVKTPRGGYDGKGVRVVRDAAGCRRLVRGRGRRGLLVEELVRSAASSPSWSRGARPARSRAWPLVETVQRDGVCAEVIAPAPARRRARRRRRASSPSAIAERARRHRRARRRAVRDDGRAPARQRARDAPAQHRPLDDRRRGHQPVRAAPARRARPAARRPVAARARGASWSTCSAARRRARCPTATRRALADQPEVKFHTYGKESRPGPQGRARHGDRRRPRRRAWRGRVPQRRSSRTDPYHGARA